MSPNDRDRSEDDFTTRLAELDEQLSGEEFGPVLPNCENLKSDDRLEGAAECLRIMERIRREIPEELDHALTDTNNESLPTPIEGAVSFDGLEERPKQIGRFRILSELGSGGYGVVFEALDPKLDRTVALKIPRPEVLMTNDLRQRFLLEAKAAATLHHPNVVPVFESGNAGPICYIASAFCEGESLAERLKRADKPFTVEEAVRLVFELAGAVQHAHNRGILHRDLKPSNVLLERSANDSSSVVPRITDFGLARIANDESIETKTGEILGTPSYMAPEQAEGTHDKVGTASDLYALGAILYELLTGQPPFRKDSILATLQAVRSDEPVPPRRLRNDVPRDLEAICLKCLEKKPENRYRAAADFAEDLQRFENHEPVEARMLTRPKRIIRWCRRKPWQATMIVTVMLSAISVAFVSGFAAMKVSNLNDELTESNRNLKRTVGELEETNEELTATHLTERQQRKRAERNYAKAREAVKEILSPGRTIGIVPHMTYLQQTQLERAIEFYKGFLKENLDQPSVRLDAARAYSDIGLMHHRLQNSTKATESLQEAIRLLENTSPQTKEERRQLTMTQAECYDILTLVNLGTGKISEAKSNHDRSWTVWGKLVADYPNDLDLQICYAESGTVRVKLLQSSRQYTQSLELCRSIRKTLESWDSESNHRLLERHADLLVSMGLTYRALGQGDSSFDCSQTACRYYEIIIEQFPVYSPIQRKLGSALNESAIVAMTLNKLDESHTAFEKSIKIAEQQQQQFPGLPGVTKQLADRYRSFSQLLVRLNKLKDAQEILGKAVDLTDRMVAQNPDSLSFQDNSASAHLGLGDTLLRLGKTDEATPHFSKTIEIFQTLVNQSPNNPRYSYQLGMGYRLMADVAERNENREEVVKNLRLSIQHVGTAYRVMPRFPSNRRQLSNSYKSLVTVLASTGKQNEAIESLKKLVNLRPSHHTFNIGAAQTALKCASIVQNDEKLSTMEKKQWAEKYSAQAIAFLESAIENGLPNAHYIERDPLLKPLHNRKEFQQLLKDLKKK